MSIPAIGMATAAPISTTFIPSSALVMVKVSFLK
jgi:hypothetical protein